MRNYFFVHTNHKCIPGLTIVSLLLVLIASIMKETRTSAVAQDDAEQQQEAGNRLVLTIKGVEYPFRWCPAGRFVMGSPTNERGRSENEAPRQVSLPQGFWMLETEVTQEMWESIMEINPSHFKSNGKLPVEKVSWDDCQNYIEKLNGLGIAPMGYRFSLPTETQWEYACRAGTTTPFHFGNTLNGDAANCNGDHPYGTNTKGVYANKTTEAGSYPANAWGLFDMHGNVWEWCLNRYVDDSLSKDRVLRGGGWSNHPEYCRSAQRNYNDLLWRHAGLGLRLAIVRTRE